MSPGTRSPSAPGWTGRIPAILLTLGLALASASTSAEAPRFPPSPYDILRSPALETPLLDAVPYCVPPGLHPVLDPVLEQADAGDWAAARQGLASHLDRLARSDASLDVLDGILSARQADDRDSWLAAEARLRSLLRREEAAGDGLCLRMERARVLMLLSRDAEAAAEWTLARRALEERTERTPHDRQIDFGRAELLYRSGRAFEAHLAFRELARSEDARIAAAARLRLTDLSFDSGRVSQVSLEYETLLPRASAFGASPVDWALRAAEAAIDVGELERALRWIELFLEEGPDRDARDAATLRLADLDVAFDDALRARERLVGLGGRRRRDPIGSLARVRAIDLGVSEGSPAERVDALLEIIRDQRRGVRRYALGVLMGELGHRGDLEGALAVATRLAYEGIDLVVMPDFAAELDDLLRRVTAEEANETTCPRVIRALGGRYGILIERASEVEPFARLGECFERLDLSWLAVTVYRTVARRFGGEGAAQVALPLARSSLAIGEISLARRMAEASLAEPGPQDPGWRAVLAQVDFEESRLEAAAEGLKAVLDARELASERGRLARLLALVFEGQADAEAVAFLSERLSGWLESGDPGARERAAMIDAALRTAHAQRVAGHEEAARVLYRLVDRHAEPGTLRASARFWLGLAGEADAEGKSAWGEDPEEALGSPWARLATFERRFAPLADAYLEQTR